MNSRLTGFIRLSRPLNVIIASAAILAVCLLAGGRAQQGFVIAVAVLIGALMTAGANAINDVYDIEIDRVNRPDRPIPSGGVPLRMAVWFWGATTTLGVLLGLLLPVTSCFIVTISAVVLYVYSVYLKRTVLAGNVVVAGMIALAFVYAGSVVDNIQWSVVPALFAFLTSYAREIVKDVQDIEGDRAHGAATMPVRYGVHPSLTLISVALLALIATTIAAVMLQKFNRWFLVPIVPVDLAFAYTAFIVWKDHSSAAMKKSSSRLKACMIAGLVAIIIGSL
jgi:geranylgeranylglycerol-phosphate geranylgeranyltransferase